MTFVCLRSTTARSTSKCFWSTSEYPTSATTSRAGCCLPAIRPTCDKKPLTNRTGVLYNGDAPTPAAVVGSVEARGALLRKDVPRACELLRKLNRLSPVGRMFNPPPYSLTPASTAGSGNAFSTASPALAPASPSVPSSGIASPGCLSVSAASSWGR